MHERIINPELCRQLARGFEQAVTEQGYVGKCDILTVLSVCTNMAVDHFDQNCEETILGKDSYRNVQLSATQHAKEQGRSVSKVITNLKNKFPICPIDNDTIQAIKDFELSHLAGERMHIEIYREYPLIRESMNQCYTYQPMQTLGDCKRAHLKYIDLAHIGDRPTDLTVSEYNESSKQIISCLEYTLNFIGHEFQVETAI